MYDYMRSSNIDLESVIDAAEIATLGRAENLETLQAFLASEESAIRYWGATGLLILGENAEPAKDKLLSALNDESANVVTVAAEALYNLGEKEAARKALLSVLENPSAFARCHALNAIDCIEEKSLELVEGVVAMMKRSPEMSRDRYDLRSAKWLMEKWELNPKDYDLTFNW